MNSHTSLVGSIIRGRSARLCSHSPCKSSVCVCSPDHHKRSLAMAGVPGPVGRRGSLKARLAAGEKVYGGFLCSQSPYFAEMMGLAGYDYVVIDLEHGPGDTISALPCVQALEAVGTPAVIRVAWNDKVLLKKALDLGPSGVIVPMVENAKQAAQAVAACRYPPVGVRGAAYSLVRASKFGLDKTYLDTVERDLLIICQIESEAGVERIPEIAGVDGVDCLMIGPRDLSASVGCLADAAHPRLAAVMRKAEQAILASSRKVFLKGISRAGVDPPPALFERGYQMVTGVVDVLLFTTAAVADVNAHKPPALSLPSSLQISVSCVSTPRVNGEHILTDDSFQGERHSGSLSNGAPNGSHVPSLVNGASLFANGTSNGLSVFATSNGSSHSTHDTPNGTSLYVNGASNGVGHFGAINGVSPSPFINGSPAAEAGNAGIITTT